MATTAALAGQALSSLPSVSRCGHSSQLTQGTAACPIRLLPIQSSRLRQHASRSVAVRAGENEGEASSEGGQEEVRRLVRGPSSDDRKWGYTEFDSAGQKNIYAVEPTIYVANNGLSTGKKGTEQGNSTAILIGVGLAVAVGAFASLNFLGNAPSTPPSVAITSVAGVDVPPLSFYIEKFSQKPALETASLPAPEVSSEAVASTNEAAEVIPEAAEAAVPEAAEAAVPEAAEAAVPEVAEVIPEAAEVIPEAAEVIPEAAEAIPEAAEVIPEAVASVTEGIAVTSSAE